VSELGQPASAQATAAEQFLEQHPEAVERIDRRYEAFGAAAEFFRSQELEVLCESGAGTGKSYSLMQKANWTARKYPGSRQIFARQTRKSLTESVLVDWEEKVLWQGHPAMTGTAKRDHRDSYTYPNGSTIVLVGLENVDRILSAQYDRIYIFQAEETNVETWEKLISRLRWGRAGYHQIVADVNPASEFHWLNQRARAGKMQRICYRHEDNPLWYDHKEKRWTTAGVNYVTNVLGALTGARRERLLNHRWVSEEGLIWDFYDQGIHLVSPDAVPKEQGWYFGSFDKGLRAPGCLQIWKVDKEKRMWRVAEVYKTGQTMDWWADRVEELYSKYHMIAIACDPSEPEYINKFNDRLGFRGGRTVVRIARKADNSLLTGLDMVDWALRERRMFFVRDSLVEGRDSSLAHRLQPCCTEEEIPSYTWLKHAEGKPMKERPDPSCADHGCDATRYAAMFLWGRDHNEEQPIFFDPGTFGEVLGHRAVLEAKSYTIQLPWLRRGDRETRRKA